MNRIVSSLIVLFVLNFAIVGCGPEEVSGNQSTDCVGEECIGDGDGASQGDGDGASQGDGDGANQGDGDGANQGDCQDGDVRASSEACGVNAQNQTVPKIRPRDAQELAKMG